MICRNFVNGRNPMELRAYLTILRRRRWIIAATLVLTVIVVLIGLSVITPKYTASTILRVATATEGTSDWVDYNVDYTDRLMNTYAKIAVSGPVRAELAQRLKLDRPLQIE